MAPSPTRRAVISASLALAACGRAQSAPAAGPVPPLKQVAPFPVGASITYDQLADPAAMALLTREFGQFTPGLEMKMETVLRDDGGFDFAKADAMVAFARANGLRVHAHTLVWYIYRPKAFAPIAGDKAAMARAYANYIQAVAGRYRGQVTAWDVVNEPTAEDGDGYRACLWREAFGMDYVARAFRLARAADPGAILFLNEYNLESLPRKRMSFLRLVEDLLKQGAPLGGLGAQMHMGLDQDPAAIAPMMKELAGFGLPIHVSELDVSTRAHGVDLGGIEGRLQTQARLVGTLADAYAALPARQRYAFTTWGLRDKDSWLRSPYQKGDPNDRPLLFDDQGRAKPAARAFVQAMGRGVSALFPASTAEIPDRTPSIGRLIGRTEYAAAFVILFLMSGGLLAPLFSPDQMPDNVPWLRTMWLPVYGVVGVMLLRDPARATRVLVGGAMSLVLVAWAFASTRWSIDADVTFRRSIAIGFTTLFGLHMASAYDWRRFIGLLAGVFFVLAAGTYVAVIAFPGFSHMDKVHPTAWTGMWYEKNQLGWLMTHGVLACACAAVMNPDRRRLWGFGAALCAGAVVMSHSTTSLLGTLMCLAGVCGLGLLRRGRATTLVTAWGALAAGGAFVGVLVFAPEIFFHLIGKEPNLTGRTDIWAAVLRQAAERPLFGYGFGAFWIDPWGPAWFIRHDVKWLVPHAHDGWLEMLVEIGAIGVGLVVLHFLVSVAAALFSLRSKGAECYWAILFMAIFALFSVSESTVMQYNGITWAIYIATMAKLLEGRGIGPFRPAPRAPRAVKLFPDE